MASRSIKSLHYDKVNVDSVAYRWGTGKSTAPIIINMSFNYLLNKRAITTGNGTWLLVV